MAAFARRSTLDMYTPEEHSSRAQPGIRVFALAAFGRIARIPTGFRQSAAAFDAQPLTADSGARGAWSSWRKCVSRRKAPRCPAASVLCLHSQPADNLDDRACMPGVPAHGKENGSLLVDAIPPDKGDRKS